MSDEPLDPPAEQPEEPAVPAFPEYSVTVAGLGTVTVIDPEGEPGSRVRLPNGAVTAFPAHSGDPCEANAAADIAWAIANPPTFPHRQETRIILDRLTNAERAALFGSTHTDIRTLVAKALATGAIRDDDPDFPAAVAGLAALNIIAANRWTALLA